MTKFLAGVLSVIAAGVLLIAYGLLSPQASAFDMRTAVDQFGRPIVPNAGMMPAAYQTPTGYVMTPVYGNPAQQPVATYPGAAYPGYQTVSYGSPAAYPAAQPVIYEPAQPVRTVVTQPAQRRVATQRVDRAPGRDWKKTALIIGGSTAGGAGLGGLIGGKKGALIGAALGGGASTIYEATKR
jgi:hypothetical protein